jgi:hypothetical protein
MHGFIGDCPVHDKRRPGPPPIVDLLIRAFYVTLILGTGALVMLALGGATVDWPWR